MKGDYLMLVVASNGEVREFPLREEDRRGLLESAARGEGRLVAIWEEVGGPTRMVVRGGTGPWPEPEPSSPPGPVRWAREDAHAFSGLVKYRQITSNPWKTTKEGVLQPDQLD
ncbi:hypothetical protein [Oceanithermus sp.]